MREAVKGWTFVAVQLLLFAALVLLPSRDHWPTPVWLEAVSIVLVAIGGLVAAVAALGLGAALTPTPVPTRKGSLQTGGLYRFARHPIYTGVLLAVAGWTLRSGNLVTALIGVATCLFFARKASWEETKLRARYSGYDDYARRTGRFAPRLRR